MIYARTLAIEGSKTKEASLGCKRAREIKKSTKKKNKKKE